METSMRINILSALKNSGKSFELTVMGFSMNPVLYEEDTVVVEPANSYDIGDILVFKHNNDKVLIHRLIEIKNDIYYCKGDNVFHMEKTSVDMIFGKVSTINRNGKNVQLMPCTDKFIIMAKAVNMMFFKRRFNHEKTRETYVYKLYKKICIDGEDIKIYIRNGNLNYTTTDGNYLTIYNPKNEDKHFLNKVDTDIMKILEQPHDLDILIEKVCEIYSIEQDEIIVNINNFINDSVKKEFVIEL